MKIWIHLNGIQQGPYDLSQLSQLPVEPTTPVWYEGLPRWTAAADAPATAMLFSTQAATAATNQPPQAPQAAFTAAPPRPATYVGWSILLAIICCSPVAVVAIVTGAISSSRYNSGDYNGARSMSNLTEWLLIFAIVFAFITAPLGIAWFI